MNTHKIQNTHKIKSTSPNLTQILNYEAINSCAKFRQNIPTNLFHRNTKKVQCIHMLSLHISVYVVLDTHKGLAVLFYSDERVQQFFFFQ